MLALPRWKSQEFHCHKERWPRTLKKGKEKGEHLGKKESHGEEEGEGGTEETGNLDGNLGSFFS
jgi:hypothetical protein